MRYRTTFAVRADQGTAFDYLADARNSLWGHPPGTIMEQVPEGQVGLGTRFVFRPPRGPGFGSTITEFERPIHLAFLGGWEGQSPMEARWTFTPVPDGTHMTVETESGFVGPRWIRPFAGLLTIAAWPLLIFKMWGFKRRISRELSR